MLQRKLLSACCLVLAALGFSSGKSPLLAQQPDSTPGGLQSARSAERKAADAKATEDKPAELPAQIDLLETRVRFEANGDSRKEVHARVRIHNELGARQFARLNFDYNRSFQQVDLPLMRITHASGGTAEILPGAISDAPNPAVVNFPAYQDVRVKSVRILGLEPGDMLEYRVVTTTTGHPLAPDFWLDHTFDRTGVVTHEIFEMDLPVSRHAEIRINPATPASSTKETSNGEPNRITYRWQEDAEANETKEGSDSQPDIVISTEAWEPLSIKLDEKLTPGAKPLEKITDYDQYGKELDRRDSVTSDIATKAATLTKASESKAGRLQAIYDFISQKIRTVDLSLGATGFLARSPTEILNSGYASPEDKFVLFAALAAAVKMHITAALTGYCNEDDLARPSVFKHLLVDATDGKQSFWLDPSLEVAPFGLIPPNSGKCAFVLNRHFSALNSSGHEWQPLSVLAPFPSTQRVNIDAHLTVDGALSGKVRYAMRGDNELLLRVAFHQAPTEKWKEVAQLLALSDGFRGTVTSVTASDPYATKEPFVVEYEISQPKFVDWAKNTVRIPALLPLVALPEPSVKAANGAGSSTIELGTPLDVQTRVTLHVPPDTGVTAPVGTSVTRDYATFSSEYSAHDLTLTAERHIKFVQQQVPAEHGADYAAFVRAVQGDQAQEFTLRRGVAPIARCAAQCKEANAKP